tara:strand:- start:303 stop:1325 length:1023 start_codon:yes stop_codon:yes gene_type:complete
MADSTVKPDSGNNLILSNDDGSAKVEVNEDGTIVLTGSTTLPATSFGDNNISNVGDIAVDTISSDAGTSVGVTLGTDSGDDFNVGSGKLVVEGDTGHIGVGTSDPDVKVHIAGTDATTAGLMIEDTNATANQRRLRIYSSAQKAYFDNPNDAYSSATDIMTFDLSNQNIEVENGNLVIGTAGKGIDFSANSTENVGGASNVGKVLMDFEEGEFSPAITGESGSSSGLSATRKGYYTRIGDIVHVTIFIENSSWGSGPSGTAYIGLPFTVKANFSSAGTLGYVNNFTKTPQRLNAYQNSAKLYIFKYSSSSVADNTGFTNLDGSEVNYNSAIYAQVTYRVA